VGLDIAQKSFPCAIAKSLQIIRNPAQNKRFLFAQAEKSFAQITQKTSVSLSLCGKNLCVLGVLSG